MDTHRDKFPPSPPTTGSSTKSSSPSLLSTAVSPNADTPPLSPDTVRSSSAKSPRSTVPLSPLPTEVVLAIVKFLPPAEQIRLCLVSRSWQAFIVGEPQFWSRITVSLDDDDLDLFQQALFRAVGNGNKKREGLRDLTISHRGHYDARTQRYASLMSPEDTVERLGQVVACATLASTIRGADGRWLADPTTARYSTLRNLRLVFRANHPDTIFLLDQFSRLARECLLFNLETLVVEAASPNFVLANQILTLVPTVRSLVLRFNCRSSLPHRNRPIEWGDWFWHQHQPQGGVHSRYLQLDHLVDLTIDSAAIVQSLFVPPSLPCLKNVALRNTTWQGKGLFRLLRIARRTLESLEFHDFTFEAILDQDLYADYCDNIDVRDPRLVDGELSVTPQDDETLDLEPPPPIHLSNLRTLRLSGTTPPLFANLQYTENDTDTEEYPTPVFWMPRLEVAHFDETNVDPETLDGDDAPPLVCLGRNAPNLSRLVLNSCTVQDAAVFQCLAAMAAQVTALDLYDSTVSDQLVAHLPQVVPRLRSLDVRSCPEVTCQGVARLAEVVRQLDDGGECGLAEVWIDKPQFSAHDARAWRWLDFVGVLRFGDDDFEGPGPSDPRERRLWLREGKKDRQWEWKEQCKKHDAEAAIIKAHIARQQALLEAGGGGSGLSSASAFVAKRQSRPPPTGFGSPGTAHAIAFPPSDRGYAPRSTAPPHPTFVLPRLPTVADPQLSLQPTRRFEVPTPRPASAVASTAPDPLATATLAPAVPPPLRETQESRLDLTSLDSIADLSELDPALVREQQLALEQIQRSHEMTRAGGRGSGGGGFSRQDAHDAAQREAQRQAQARREYDARQYLAHRQRTTYALAGLPTAVVPATESRIAGLEHVRTAGGFVCANSVAGPLLEEREEEEDGATGHDKGFAEEDLEVDWVDEDDFFNYEDSSHETDSLHPTALG
ncbi:hypothetical protein JCM11491_001691 [Sporobolomyces phaffii]